MNNSNDNAAFDAYFNTLVNNDLQTVSTSQGELFWVLDLYPCMGIKEVYFSDQKDVDTLIPLSDSGTAEENPELAEEIYVSIEKIFKAQLAEEEKEAKEEYADRMASYNERGY